MFKLLITCPPMVQRIKEYDHLLKNYEVYIPEFDQTVSESELIKLVPNFDAWIAGDDPATRNVLTTGAKGRLKILIKWGIGTDNIDRDTIKELGIKFSNTPEMFGDEVSDVAIGYLIALTRKLYTIDKNIRKGLWHKPSGISIRGKKVALIGFGDIGRNIARRLLVMGAYIYVSDPGFSYKDNRILCHYSPDIFIPNELHNQIVLADVRRCLDKAKIVILSCPLVDTTYHLINRYTLGMLDNECYIVNVSRGLVVKETDLIEFLGKKISGFASDVFENEPISSDHPLIKYDNVILGSHNASNTVDAVDKTSFKAIDMVNNFLR